MFCGLRVCDSALVLSGCYPVPIRRSNSEQMVHYLPANKLWFGQACAGEERRQLQFCRTTTWIYASNARLGAQRTANPTRPTCFKGAG
jgi:hypothetical protein